VTLNAERLAVSDSDRYPIRSDQRIEQIAAFWAADRIESLIVMRWDEP
jgi:hypothetical protein